MQPVLYQNPTHRVFGEGTFESLPEILKSYAPKTILLVLGEKSFRESPAFVKLQKFLESYKILPAAPVSQNPTQEFLQEEIHRFRLLPFDLVLAIGGGSVIDAAKLYAFFPKSPNPEIASFIQDPAHSLKTSPAPLIAVPTTSGTGSEVTPYSSLSTPEKKKITVGHSLFYPKVAIIDPELTYSMPGYVTASTGFDALSQAIESFWSRNATPFSQTHALRAIELIEGAFDKAFREPQNAEARKGMALASCEAGLAIAHTKTTAVHSVSYPVTAHFGVAHGHACALTLAEFARFNAPVLKEGGRPMLAAFKTPDYESMAQKIETLMEKLTLEKSLSKLHIDENGRELIVQEGFRPDRILNNPRHVEAQDLKKILYNIR